MPKPYLWVSVLALSSFSSACANTCGSEEKKTETTTGASTSAEGGPGHGGGSRFAKPYVPGAGNTALPERDM